ncbi:ABC transporter permease [Blochmannia endosymbiont of Colobopsis nipponica]|uniref:FtsX-like permease family protein n=1 Tax=Blochmannia endosymbiont of Colobopsis nipponica TaxID=2681987 RepID=UPI0017845F2A|nr:FtsX-like permease family protein [Blochmannia endosymbiont of Colobopsis nipponica]QOI11056.1 ABC transporter permease [Blochmannia endosymbiont of Colobopsis nipponica]
MRYVFRVTKKLFNCFVFWFSGIVIAIGLSALIIVLSVMNGFEHELENAVLKFLPQVLITNVERKINLKDEIPISLLHSLQDDVQVTSLTMDNVILHGFNGLAVGLMLGINPNNFEPLAPYLLNTSLDQLVPGKYQIILGKQLAEQLGVSKGDYIRLIIPNVNYLTIIGNIFGQRLFKVLGVFDANSEVNYYQLLIHQQDASRLMHYPEGYVTGWRLFFKRPLLIYDFKKQNLPNKLIWEDWRIYKGNLFQAVCLEKNMMSLLLFLIIIVAIFNIITSLSILIMEKKIDIAILQVQGLKRYQVLYIFIFYGMAAIFFGSILGVNFGIFLVKNLNLILCYCNMLEPDFQIPVFIEPIQIFVIVLLNVILSFLVILYFSKRTISIYPAKILSHVK